MIRFLFFAIALLLSLSGGAAAQQPHLAERDDRNDPCRHFKLRILEPLDGVDYKLRVKPAQPIDPKMPGQIDAEMEVNPCPREESALALAPLEPQFEGGRPDWQAPLYRIVPRAGSKGQGVDFLRPQLPTAMEMMRGQR